jgi:iron(III) transport system substrate-binding protein
MRVHPGIDLQWDDMGSTEVLDRVRAERDNPQADVWFGAPAELFERAAREGLLEAYTRRRTTRPASGTGRT